MLRMRGPRAGGSRPACGRCCRSRGRPACARRRRRAARGRRPRAAGSGTRTGSGNSFAVRNITESLPSWLRMPCIASERAERVAVGVLVGGRAGSGRSSRIASQRPARASLARSAPALTSSSSRRAAAEMRIAALGRVVVVEAAGRACASCAARGDGGAAGRRGRTAGPRASPRAPPRSPSTLTYTRAWRRSGLVSTAVTVTNPIRGSLSSSVIAPRSGPRASPR